MDRREVIAQAIENLNARNSYYSAILNRTGRVRVAVIPPLPAVPSVETPVSDLPGPYVVAFSFMEHVTGNRLVAEYDGKTEFVA